MNPLFEATITILRPLIEQNRKRFKFTPRCIPQLMPGEKVKDNENVSVVLTMAEYKAIVTLFESLNAAKGN